MASSLLPFKRSRSTEDTVRYWLYSEKEAQVTAILSAVVKLAHEYVWNEETFSLKINDKSVNHLRGSTRFGANIEDE
uniref:Uncharacterized protein n=1 Tax=Plectus sambesii TaxID=2011161 RepID=A0A914UI05_9BILA